MIADDRRRSQTGEPRYRWLVSGSMSFDVFDLASAAGTEEVSFTADPATGLRAIVAVHSTVLGPSLGGTRFLPYDTEEAAFLDVLRLAHGMTYKHAVAGNDLGGGKGVIIGDPRLLRSDELFRVYGRFIDRLGGRYVTAEDVGTTTADMDLIRTVTRFVTGVSRDKGGSGDPSPATAWGVLHAMYAVAERLWGSPSLDGRHVLVSGIGKVGMSLVGHLRDNGARVTVSDIRPEALRFAVDTHGASVADDPAKAHTIECDIFSPCALGAVLNAVTIPALRCAAVCGAANNQLAEEADGDRLAERGILYVPDYVANAGGVINIRPAGGHGQGGQHPPDRARGVPDRRGEGHHHRRGGRPPGPGPDCRRRDLDRRAMTHPGAGDCETLHPGPIAQPVNAITSLAYLAGGIDLFVRAARSEDEAASALGPAFAGLLLANGIGGVAFHGPGNRSAKWLHDVALTGTLSFIILHDVALLVRIPGRHALAGFAVTVAGLGAMLAYRPGHTNAASAVAGGTAAILELAVAATAPTAGQPHQRAARRHAAVLLGGATVVNLLSRTGGPLCRPDSPIQGHGIWHAVTAAALRAWARPLVAS